MNLCVNGTQTMGEDVWTLAISIKDITIEKYSKKSIEIKSSTTSQPTHK
jgi:hypothetical protein